MNKYHPFGIAALILVTVNVISSWGIGSMVASEPEFLDSNGEPVTEILVGKQVFVRDSFLSLFENIGTQDIGYVSIMQVKDSNGFTEELSSIEGHIKRGETVTPTHSWTPTRSEEFTVWFFVWTNLTKPLPIAPIKVTTVTVFPLVKEYPVAKDFEFVPKDLRTLEVLLNPGESFELPLEIRLVSQRYEEVDMRLLFRDSASETRFLITPNPLYFAESNRSVNATISILVDSNAIPANYTVGIFGEGYMQNLRTGDYLTVKNEQIASLRLIIEPVASKITIDTEKRDRHPVKFCVPTLGCGSFSGYEEYAITVYSDERRNIELETLNVPEGVYARFVPDRLSNVGPEGTSTTLIVAGASGPRAPYPVIGAEVITIEAVSSDSIVARNFLPVAQGKKLTILDSPRPIEFFDEIWIDTSGTNYQSFGVVYDPYESLNGSLSVNLSVLGLLKGGEIFPIPSWLQLEIPKDSFALNATKPYYFIIKANTDSAPVGTHTIVIEEIIAGQHFVEKLKIRVLEPIQL